MSAVELTDPQNTALGVAAAFIEGVILQPTLYWKNARAMKLPFTLDPRVIYRGTGASIFNEMQMMGLQFGITAILGGVITATFSCPVELVMIQQQKHSGSLIGTPIRIAKQFGVGSGGLFRGLTLTMTRDGIYVAGMLGMTPLMQQYLMDKQNMSINRASFVASVVGGVFGAVLSHPMDVVKTCMQSDLERKTYKSLREASILVWEEGGLNRVFNGLFWRTFNIVGTVYIANECRNRLPKYMFNLKPKSE